MQTKHLISFNGVPWQAGRGGDKQHSVKARFNKYNVMNDTFTLYYTVASITNTQKACM